MAGLAIVADLAAQLCDRLPAGKSSACTLLQYHPCRSYSIIPADRHTGNKSWRFKNEQSLTKFSKQPPALRCATAKGSRIASGRHVPKGPFMHADPGHLPGGLRGLEEDVPGLMG
jgi:hypothetical protein